MSLDIETMSHWSTDQTANAEVVRGAIEYLKEQGILFGSVWTPDPGHLNSQLWQQLNPPDWQRLLQMMDSYRSIKRLAFDTGVELWAQQGGESDVVQ